MRAKAAVIASVIGVILGSVVCLGTLNHLYFTDFLIDTYDGRLLATATNLRNIFVQALTMGLPLREFEGGGHAVEEAANSDADLRYAAVFDLDGDRFVALRGTTKPGNPLPAAWMRAMRREPSAPFWQIESDEGFGVLVPVANTFNRTVGLIALIHSRDSIDAAARDFDTLLWRIGISTSLPIAIWLIPGSIWAVRPVMRSLPEWNRFAHAFVQARRAGTPAPELPGMQADDDLSRLLQPPYAVLLAGSAGAAATRDGHG
jgi:hypothetical protein